MKNSKLYIKIFAPVFVVIIFCCAFLAVNTYGKVQAESHNAEYLVYNGIYDGYTNTNAPNGIFIQKYADDYYATKAEMSGIGIGTKMTVSGDDPIVNIVPRELLQTI